jgi:hypothetical protein
MAPASLFIGLVSYEKSSFPRSQGPAGLAATLDVTVRNSGVGCHLLVNTGNLFDKHPFPLRPKMARESVREEIRLESKWCEFLERGGRPGQLLRLAGRRAKFFLDWNKNSQDRELRRLLNIEYSHVDLYRRAIATGATWAIILEDDAASTDVSELASGLLALAEARTNIKMINLSESFTLDQVGVRHLLGPIAGLSWSGTAVRAVLGSKKPATNTVCAIAFRTDFLGEILADFDSQRTFPVVPIDWKLNASLMRLHESGAIGVDECLFIEPAPIIQLSMVKDREAK